ncbi:helicase I [Polynucleobacter wuianus]|uniref:Helicase I n=1 Tax=Polynucleobacter wuianus TaxID=1743168 RepID=A0A191UE95_9BURK|nr:MULTISPECIES: PD-(D/E)XK nuclease family protein [Polynucleobacter]ANI99267.1 helicase I [Polynucleobacter wuianus]MBU3552144.1 PD-(D/E)XK nuclease family protein [Polynucleobacter sp. MWH-Post4-6-1]MBU3609579.1 PD-(D/E)XK nuclease family protein [Polynucleobacter wuianus]
MPFPFPANSDQKQVQSWAITPDASALEQLAKGIWDCAVQTQQRPLVVLSTAGPLIGVRAALEKHRPPVLGPKIAFLPQVISFADWLEAAPGAWKFPKKQSDLERWLGVYSTLRNHKELQAWFKAESETGAWGLAQAIVEACDTLSKAISPQLQKQTHTWMEADQVKQSKIGETSLAEAQALLDATVAKVYSGMARKVVDQETKVLLTFWRYTANLSDPVFRNQFAMAAHLEAIAQKANQARPLIWVETADPTLIDQEIIGSLLNSYAQHAPVIEVKMDWRDVGLWAEAISAEDAQAKALTNAKCAQSAEWRLISAKRFEELAWAAAKTIEQHLINNKTKLALVAQDRLVARRARALLARLGPALNIRDETGWKLSTTRAAAALNSWLELIRAPKDGPSAKALLEFLQNPFLDLGKILNRDPDTCVGLIAELEDILVASKAESGWKTFHLAIEGAQDNATKTSTHLPSTALLELMQFFRERHHEWLTLKVDCKKAYALLQVNLQATGMAHSLDQDSAGKQLLEVLKAFDLSKTAYQETPIRLSEWLSLLKTVVEGASYQEAGKEAKATLSILPLSSTRLRDFEAVVVVGCDEQQLPAYSEPPLFFSDALNQLLRTSTIAMQFVQQARDLSQLLVSCPSVDLLWQSKSNNGEPLRPSAWIQRLQNQIGWEAVPTQLKKRAFEANPMDMAVAQFEEELPMPLSMSPSAYKALRDCPYRYYVRSLLGLRKNKGFDEGFDASLAGQTLHKLLKRFYQALKTQEHTNPAIKTDQEQRRAWMEKSLFLHSEQEFASLIEGDARVMGTLRDWQKQIPSFVDWQLQREQAGWEYFDGEVKVGFDLPFEDAQGNPKVIRIEGFADRYDVNINNNKLASVIDYKNQRFERVKERAQHLMDDPQLLIYARAANEGAENHKITGHQVQQAEWVALKADLSKGDQKALRGQEVADMPAMMQQFSDQITEDVEQLWAKKTMQAFAPEGVCQYCEARGICRKGIW